MTTYVVDIDPLAFAPLLNGTQTLLRLPNNQSYKNGDVLQLREYDKGPGVYTGRTLFGIVAGIGDEPGYFDLLFSGGLAPPVFVGQV